MSQHDWKPTGNTHAVYICTKCGRRGFNPHPLPTNGCRDIEVEVAGVRFHVENDYTNNNVERVRSESTTVGTSDLPKATTEEKRKNI